MGRFDEARNHYQRYAELYPTDPRSFTALADLYGRMGDHEQSRAENERALLLEPDDIDVMIRLSRSHFNLGDFEAVERQLDEALSAARTAEQRARVYNALSSYKQRRGEVVEELEFLELEYAELESFRPPLNLLMDRMNHLDTYVRAGQEQRALRTLEELEAQVQPPFDALLGLGAARVFIELEDPDRLEAAAEALAAGIDRLGFELLRPFSVYARGRALELIGDCEQAIVAFETALKLQPTFVSLNTDIGRCHRSLGDLARAEDYALRAIRILPYDAEALLEAARILAEARQTDRALEHLNKALAVWENADAAFEPAREARELLAELTGRF